MAAYTHPLPARVEFIESTRRLSRVTGAEVTVLLPWPMVKAFRRPQPRGPWTACTPDFAIPPDQEQPLRAGGAATSAGTAGGDVDVDGLRNVHRFCLTIPCRVRRAVAQFPERHWDLLSWVARTGPAADQLLESNPALAFAVACGADLCDPQSRATYRDSLFLQAYHSQHTVMARLGFPPTERARHILRKVQPRAVIVARLRQLRLALEDADVADRLAHVSQINIGVLTMVEDRTIAHVEPSVLERIGCDDGDGGGGDAARALAEAVRLWGLVRPTTPVPQFHRLARIHDVHSELREDAEKLAGAGADEFPSPPVPGTSIVVPIRTNAVLIEEGRRQKNCAADYAKRIADGTMAIYRVLSPERCTLSLRVSRGRWVFDQLRTACNAAVSPATERAVAEWLARSPIIHVPRRRSRCQ